MNKRIRRFLVVIAASAAALLLWAIAVPVAGVDLTVRQGGADQEVGPVMVVFAGLVAGFAAWGLLAALERATARAGRIWMVIAAAVLAVSLLGTLGAVGGAATLVLMGEHLVVGGVLIGGLVRR
ncbi:DUF6069 family protein [Glycomyces sp. NRRL B-16210]|uniref:DUF6069 family protein n=1 Tax=Glycomyces sp. NRRL B-16210 TaxID=1463821 RepID=UPI000A8C6E05|nr:DUF6069 family protein [Glycomyces sp. NRRL B-16210]